MSGQYIIHQLLAKNNIILDQDSITMIEDDDPDKKYNCDKYTRSKGFTLLHKLVLIANNYPKLSDVIKEYILLYPEEVNKVNEEGWSALLLATSNNILKVVKLLLSCAEHNANALRNINVKNNNGLTALMYESIYATESSPKIVKLLLEHNVDINVKDNDGWTALMYALYLGTESSPKIVKLLLEHDSIPNNKELCAAKDIKVLNTKN